MPDQIQAYPPDLSRAPTANRAAPSSSVPPQSSADVLSVLRQCVMPCTELPQLQNAIAGFLRNQIRTPLVAWYYPGGDQIGQEARIEGLLCPTDGITATLQKQLSDAAVAAIQSRRIHVGAAAGNSLMQLAAVPLNGAERQCLLVLHESTLPQSSESRAVLLLSLCAAMIDEWCGRRKAIQLAADATAVAAMVEMISHVQSASDADSACRRLADSLQKYLSASRVFVGLCRDKNSDPRLRAVSGQNQIDRLSETCRLAEATLHESTAREVVAVWPAVDATNRHSLMAHAQLAAQLNCQFVVSVPLKAELGSSVGAILVTFGEPSSSSPPMEADLRTESVPEPSLADVQKAERFLRAAASSLASCLQVLQKLADSRILESIRAVRTWFTHDKLKSAGVLSAVILGALLIPVHYSVRCKCELQPIERRYVAAPFAGPLLECLVEPGDLVAANQLLARMDGREVRWELAGTQADLNKATKERNTHLNTHEFGSAAIARHEVERLQNRADLLQHRDSSLEIRSPVSGIVVSGDHREAEGVPLEAGQSLFEIAPLERMVIEICIPEEDIRHVADGQTVRLQLDANPQSIFEATIRRIHPRAELRDNQNVFVAEAELQNEELQLRPGMRGTAKVIASRHLLGWNLFHKPWAHVLGWLGW